MEEVEISYRRAKISNEILEPLLVILGKKSQLSNLNLDFLESEFETKKISEEAIANGFLMLKTLILRFYHLKGG